MTKYMFIIDDVDALAGGGIDKPFAENERTAGELVQLKEELVFLQFQKYLTHVILTSQVS